MTIWSDLGLTKPSVVADGAPDAVTALEYLLSRLNEFDVRRFGGVAGALDNSTAVDAAHAAAAVAGGTVVIPGGLWIFDTVTLLSTATNPRVFWRFENEPILQPLNADSALFEGPTSGAADHINFIGNFTVKPHASGANCPAIRLRRMRFCHFDRIAYLGGAGNDFLHLTFWESFCYANRIEAIDGQQQNCSGMWSFATCDAMGSGPNNANNNPNANSIGSINAYFTTIRYLADLAESTLFHIGGDEVSLWETNTVTACIVPGNFTYLGNTWIEANTAFAEIREIRTAADGVTTSGSPTVTSATAAWTTAEVGRQISGPGIPAGSYIGVRNSATSIGLSSSRYANVPVNATASASGLFIVWGESISANGVILDNNYFSGGTPLTIPPSVAGWAVYGGISGLAITDNGNQGANLTVYAGGDIVGNANNWALRLHNTIAGGGFFSFMMPGSGGLIPGAFIIRDETTPSNCFIVHTGARNGGLQLQPAGPQTAGLLLTELSGTGYAGFRLPHGVAPTSPVNGDMWTTGAGLFVRINGVTVGPLS